MEHILNAEGRSFTKIFGAGEDSLVERVAKVACMRGYAVVPVQPMGKAPICTLNLPERRAADKEAWQQGRTQHECGVKEYITDPDKAQRIFTRLAKGYGDMQLNIGVVAHPSRIVVVDCDQTAEVIAFQQQWAQESGDDAYLEQTPTVLSPGLKDGDTWVHQGGGHFVFDLPDGVELPVTPGYYKDKEGNFDVKWGMSQSLVGPSVRAEGPYQVASDVVQCPDWLLDRISRRIQEHAAHLRAKAELVPNDSIAAWSQRIDWAELLLADGWTETFKSDACGCPTFTRPGGASTSPKSATGHNNDCQVYPNMEAHGPLHIWSTNAPEILEGKTTLTKLQYYTLTREQGDEDAAMTALGLERATNEDVKNWVDSMEERMSLTVLDDDEDEPEVDPEIEYLESTGMPESEWTELRRMAAKHLRNEAAKGLVEVQRALDKSSGKAKRNVEMLTGEDLWTAFESPVRHVPTIGERSDGCNLLYPGRTSAVAGRPGTGKSWLSILIAQQVLSTGGKVVVLDFEDTPKLSMTRMLQIGADIKGAIFENRLMYADTSAVMDSGDFTMVEVDIKKFKPNFIIVDSANAFISCFGPIEDNTLVTKLYRRLAKMAQENDAALLIIDHLPKNREVKSAIGAQAKQAALTGTFFMMEQIGSGFKPGQAGACLLSFFEKDRLGGVAAYAVDGQVAIVRMNPSMVAPTGMTEYDGISMTLEPIPAEGMNIEQPSDRDKARWRLIEVMTEAGGTAQKSVLRQKLSTALMKELDPAIKDLIDDGMMEVVCPRPVMYRLL